MNIKLKNLSDDIFDY